MHYPLSVPSRREHLSLFFFRPYIAPILVIVGQAVFEIDQTLIDSDGHNVQVVCQLAQPFVFADKLDVLFWDHFVRSNEKRERRPGRSSNLREEAEQNSTSAGVPFCGTGFALLLFFKDLAVQVRGFRRSRFDAKRRQVKLSP